MATKKHAAKREAKQMANVRINTVGDQDEVFITSDKPYVNKVVHAKHGLFKEGEFPLDELEKKEEQTKPQPNAELGKIEPAAG